ncbi:unnamed protein product, partial [Discosporangium mesarthrocarpum]
NPSPNPPQRDFANPQSRPFSDRRRPLPRDDPPTLPLTQTPRGALVASSPLGPDHSSGTVPAPVTNVLGAEQILTGDSAKDMEQGTAPAGGRQAPQTTITKLTSLSGSGAPQAIKGTKDLPAGTGAGEVGGGMQASPWGSKVQAGGVVAVAAGAASGTRGGAPHNAWESSAAPRRLDKAQVREEEDTPVSKENFSASASRIGREGVKSEGYGESMNLNTKPKPRVVSVRTVGGGGQGHQGMEPEHSKASEKHGEDVDDDMGNDKHDGGINSDDMGNDKHDGGIDSDDREVIRARDERDRDLAVQRRRAEASLRKEAELGKETENQWQREKAHQDQQEAEERRQVLMAPARREARRKEREARPPRTQGALYIYPPVPMEDSSNGPETKGTLAKATRQWPASPINADIAREEVDPLQARWDEVWEDIDREREKDQERFRSFKKEGRPQIKQPHGVKDKEGLGLGIGTGSEAVRSSEKTGGGGSGGGGAAG